jgi:hypothetical protein
LLFKGQGVDAPLYVAEYVQRHSKQRVQLILTAWDAVQKVALPSRVHAPPRHQVKEELAYLSGVVLQSPKVIAVPHLPSPPSKARSAPVLNLPPS